MTVDEAKEILFAANLRSIERVALQVLLSELDSEDLPSEIWRDVVGCEGHYQVSNFGRVKSFHKGKAKILSDCVQGAPERGFKPFAKKFNVTPGIIRDAYYGKSYQNVD